MIKSIEQKLFLLKNIQLNKNIILIKKHVTNDKINIKIRLNLNKKKKTTTDKALKQRIIKIFRFLLRTFLTIKQ